MQGWKGLWWIGLFFFSGGCEGRLFDPKEEGTMRSRVVYGTDDRTESALHPDSRLQAMGQGVALSLSSANVDFDETTKRYTLKGSTLTKKIEADTDYGFPLCAGEKFLSDPAPGSCTVFLVGPRRVMTAGHCIESTADLSPATAQNRCNSRTYVFGFQKQADGSLPAIGQDDVYSCRRVLLHRYDENPSAVDIALVELDRDVKGYAPLALDAAPTLAKDQKLALIGHPHGIPKKTTSGEGAVFSPRTTQADYFTHNLDVTPGASGSPVILLSTYRVVGVHVRSPRPVYDKDETNACLKSHVRPADETKDLASAAYLAHAVPKACQTDNDCTPRHACEKGECLLRFQDLAAEDLTLSPPHASRLGESITARFFVKNVGTAAIQGPFRVGLWWSSNSTISPSAGQDKNLAFQEVSALPPGERKEIRLPFSVTSEFIEGTQYIGAYVDDLPRSESVGQIAEVTASNNSIALAFVFGPKEPPKPEPPPKDTEDASPPDEAPSLENAPKTEAKTDAPTPPEGVVKTERAASSEGCLGDCLPPPKAGCGCSGGARTGVEWGTGTFEGVGLGLALLLFLWAFRRKRPWRANEEG